MASAQLQHGPYGPRLFVVLWAGALLGLSGCQSVHCGDWCCKRPQPQIRSIEELYFEALAIPKPESTLGLEHPRGGTMTGNLSGAPVTHPGSMSPSGQPAAIPLTPPASAPPPLAPLPVGAATPARNAAVQTVAHAQHRSSFNRVIVAGSSGEKLVSDIFTETDVREAIQGLASQAGVAIVLDDTARGNVTCTIENEPFEEALQRILLPLGLVYCRKDALYLIGSNEPTSNLFSHIAETIEFRPNHLSAQELIALLPPRQSQFVRMVEKRNLIVVEAPHDTAQNIYAQLQSADQPIPQIMIEAVICVVAPEKGLQFGVDWNHGLKVQGLDAFNIGLNGLSFTGAVSPYGANNAFDDFAVTSAFIKLLAKEGYVTIRAAPRVMAKDGEKAEISIARDTFFSIQQANNQFLFNQNIQKVESGISLILTPAIRGDTVQIQIEKAEVSEDVRSIDPAQQLNNNPYPIINRRNVTTTVQVKDRQTIVIGGLVARQEVDRESRIPVLGDLPLIGGLFRKIERQEQDAEVAIFISPQIVVPTAAPSEPFSDSLVPTLPVEIPQPAPELLPQPSPIETSQTQTPKPTRTAPTAPTSQISPATHSGAVIPQLRVVPAS